MKNQEIKQYLSLLSSELVPAAGCTEPIAIAFCAAKLRDVLGDIPEKLTVGVSDNILKNAKCVTVPSTGGLKGIRAAVSAGIVAGDASRELEVIADAPAETATEIKHYLETTPMELAVLGTNHTLEIRIKGGRGDREAVVHVVDKHNNIVFIERDGEVLLDATSEKATKQVEDAEIHLSVRNILEFASEAPADLLAEIFERQIAFNTAIAEEGLANDWGAGIGKLLHQSSPFDVEKEAKAYAAAGSDARMSGCNMPVIIVSGSGNQGLTSSLPVICYARHIGESREKLHRALAVSALVTLQQKSGIGRLSAYCGAVSAGVGAGAGIAYLLDGGYDAIAHTIVNAIVVISGTICDGAKPSCAAKIAASVEAGILGFNMYRHGKQFYRGEGVVMHDVDSTIETIGIIASDGMAQTDRTIVSIMTQSESV